MADIGHPLKPRKKTTDDPKRIGLWKIGRTIGTGSSGRVRIARHSKTGQYAAIKIISKIELNSRVSLNHLADQMEHDRLAIELEIVVMKLMDHPNVMRLYDVWETSTELYLILEYVQGGELFDYMCHKGKFEVPEALNYFQQIIGAIDYCHRFNIAHRDLKPENILLDKDFNIKIADFGMAAWQVNYRNGMLRTSCGSPHYAAPEVVKGEAYHGSAADTWSCGVILFALLAGKLPFDHEDCDALLNQIKIGKYDMPIDIDPLAQNLIRRMLAMDVTQRITMPEIIEHPFFRLHEPKFNTRDLPKLIDGAHPIPSPIDPDIFANIRTLWHNTLDVDIVASLRTDEPTWQKGIYHLLIEYREKHLKTYEDEEEKIAQDRLERKKSRKAKAMAKALQSALESVNIAPSPSSLPPRDGPPTPRRAAGQDRRTSQVSDESICEHLGYTPAPAINLQSPSPSTSPTSPYRDPLPPLTVPELQDDKMQAFFHQIVHHLNALQAKTNFPEQSNWSSNPDFHAGLTDDRPNRTHTPPSTPANMNYRSPMNAVQEMGSEREDEVSRALGIPQNGTRPLSVRRKPRPPQLSIDVGDKENVGEDERSIVDGKGNMMKRSSLKRGKGSRLGEKRVHIVEPSEKERTKLVKKRSRGSVSPAFSDTGSSFTLPSPSPFSLSPFSSSPKRMWIGNVFNFRPATLSLLSAYDVQTTRNECRRLLMTMDIRVVLEDSEGLGVLRCKLAEGKEPSGVMNVLKAVKFRVEFQRPQACGQRREEIHMMSLTLIRERGSVETFREVCKRLERDWKLGTFDRDLGREMGGATCAMVQVFP